MTTEPDPFGEEAAVDEGIRRLAAESSGGGAPSGIGGRVLARVRRRRRTVRAGYAAAAVAAAAGIVLLVSTRRHPGDPNGRSERPMASAESVPGAAFPALESDQTVAGAGDAPQLDELLRDDGGPLGFIASPPPVFSLDLLASNQSAMLDSLETLEEALP